MPTNLTWLIKSQEPTCAGSYPYLVLTSLPHYLRWLHQFDYPGLFVLIAVGANKDNADGSKVKSPFFAAGCMYCRGGNIFPPTNILVHETNESRHPFIGPVLSGGLRRGWMTT